MIHGWTSRLAFLQPEFGQHGVHFLGAENAHEVVFEGEEEERGAGVALPAGAAAQLVVDAPCLVALAAHHEQPAGGEHLLAPGRDLGADVGGGPLPRHLVLVFADFVGDAELHVAAELDVGAAAGHVGWRWSTRPRGRPAR